MKLASIGAGMVIGLAVALPGAGAPRPAVKPLPAVAATPAIDDADQVGRDLDALCATLASAAAGFATERQDDTFKKAAADVAGLKTEACREPYPGQTPRSRLTWALYQFSSLANQHPESYTVLVQLPGVRDRLRAIETSYERRFFASEEAIARGKSAAQALLRMVSKTRAEWSGTKQQDDDDWDEIDLEEIEKELQAHLDYPVPAQLQALAPLGRLASQIDKLYTSDQMQGRLDEGPLNDLVMEFYLSVDRWQAHQHLFILASTHYSGAPAKTLRYGAVVSGPVLPGRQWIQA